MASVQGTVPDQSWALSLPSKFHENIQPTVYDANFLLPRDNDLIPNVVSKNTTGACYDRGYIDLRPGRKETIRQYITNPSSYVSDLHPFGLGGGTGGVDNLNKLDNHGHPLPVANMEGFEEMEYLARRESLIESLDPLSNGYAIKVLGQQGETLMRRHELSRQLVEERDRMLAARRELTLREGQAMNPAVADIGAANRVASESAAEIDRAANDEILRRAEEAALEAQRAQEGTTPGIEISLPQPRPSLRRERRKLASDDIASAMMISEISRYYSNPNSGGATAGQGTETNLQAQESAAQQEENVAIDQNNTVFRTPQVVQNARDTLDRMASSIFRRGPPSQLITLESMRSRVPEMSGLRSSVSGMVSTPSIGGAEASSVYNATATPGVGGANTRGVNSSLNNTPQDAAERLSNPQYVQNQGGIVLARRGMDASTFTNSRFNYDYADLLNGNTVDGNMSTPYEQGELGATSLVTATLPTAEAFDRRVVRTLEPELSNHGAAPPNGVRPQMSATFQRAIHRAARSRVARLHPDYEEGLGPLGGGPIRRQAPTMGTSGPLNLVPQYPKATRKGPIGVRVMNP